jgi:hypothetical protein
MTEKKRESDHLTAHEETSHADGIDYSKLGAEHGGSDFERRDVNPQKILLVTLIGVVSFVVILIGVSEYFLMTKEEMVAESVLKPPSSALRDLRAQEDEILNSYKIVDASKNIYQIPVGEAMKRIAEEAYQAQKNPQKEKSVKKK